MSIRNWLSSTGMLMVFVGTPLTIFALFCLVASFHGGMAANIGGNTPSIELAQWLASKALKYLLIGAGLVVGGFVLVHRFGDDSPTGRD